MVKGGCKVGLVDQHIDDKKDDHGINEDHDKLSSDQVPPPETHYSLMFTFREAICQTITS